MTKRLIHLLWASACFTRNIVPKSFILHWALFLSLQAMWAQVEPSFLYVTNNVITNASIYRIDPGSGALTLVGATPPGSGATAIVVTPDQRFLYVTNIEGNSISGFSVNKMTGMLTAVPGSPFPLVRAGGIVVHPNGQFLFVTKGNPSLVIAYRIDAATGVLTQVSQVAAHGNRPSIDPEGKFLYLPDGFSDQVVILEVDSVTGALTFVDNVPAGPGPVQTVVHPTGSFVYATNGSGSSISGYTRNPVTGLLTPMPGSPFAAPGAWTFVIDPTGLYGYASALIPGTAIATFSIDPTTGVLSAVGSPLPAAGYPYFSSFDKSGTYLYVPGYNGTSVLGYKYNPATGELTPVPGSPYPSADLEPVATAVIGPKGGNPITADSHFQVRYVSNLNVVDSLINVTNTGVNGAMPFGPGIGPQSGNICVNIYAFSPDEQMVGCCSCHLTPNGLVSLSIYNDIRAITLTGLTPNSMVIKLVATATGLDIFSGGASACSQSAAGLGITHSLANGMSAWATTGHIPGAFPVPGAPSPFASTETPFTPATLSPGELVSLNNRCTAIIGNGSSFGTCRSCSAGGRGAMRQ